MEEPKKKRAPRSSRSSVRAARETATPKLKRWSRLLTKAEQDPLSVLKDQRCLRPHFVEEFFRICEARILEAPWMAEDFIEAAMGLAQKAENPHYALRGADLLIHTCINFQAWEKAAELVEEFRELALACCKPCTSRWLRRKGDLLLETQDSEASRQALDESMAVLGDDLDDETRGHALFLRGIAYYGSGSVDRALDDMGQALRLWPLSTRKEFFTMAIALVACFLEHTDDLDHFEAALEHLEDFRERLYKQRYWNEVRDRLRWVTGQIEANLDQRRLGRPRLERARKNTAKYAPHRHTLAIGLDEALLYCHERPELYGHSILRVLRWCASHLKLEQELGDALRETIAGIEEEPYRADALLWQLRQSYVVPVPCLVGRL